MTDTRPARGEYLIRGGDIVSVDPDVGDIRGGDVHVRDGVIVAVAPHVEAPGAEVIDARDTVIVPGFVDTHWHMWNSIWKGLSDTSFGYFRLHRLATSYTPDDHYTAVRYAAAEAVHAGYTTCHDWAPPTVDPADVEAHIRALADAGVRARFSYGGASPFSSQPATVDDLARAVALAGEQAPGLIDCGVAVMNPATLPAEVAAARELGLRTIAVHADLSAHAGLVGPDFLYTHGTGASPAEIGFVASTGMPVALCPLTDPLIGAGMSPLIEMVEGGVPRERLGLSVDVSCQTPVDPFASMRTLLAAGRMAQRRDSSFTDIVAEDLFGNGPSVAPVPAREVLEIATLNGARVLGLDGVTGSLTPGKRADLVAVRTDRLGMLPAPGADPVVQLVLTGRTEDVSLVLADGRVLKRDDELVGVDRRALVRAAASAQTGLLSRAGSGPAD